MSKLILNDKLLLRRPCTSASPEEARQIILELEQELALHPDGIGLAAPQIGILKNVAIVRYKGQKLDLIKFLEV